MKKYILSAAVIAISIVNYAGIEKEIPSEIKNVTVYQRGAQVSRETSVTIPAGETTLVFKGLPAEISPESIQAKISGDIMITSVTHNIDYLNKNVISEEVRKLNEKRRMLADSIRMLNNYKAVYLQEKEMIVSNKSIGGDDGVDISELEQAAAFFRKRLMEIESQTHRIDNILYSVKNDLVSTSGQLLELNARIDQPSSVVSVVVNSPVETAAEMSLEYYINDAGWTPAYDIRIRDVSEPLSLFYKARVFQNSDENWDNVKLVLSTGNPSLGNNKPVLSAYYLTFNNYYRGYQDKRPAAPVNGKVTGRIFDAETGETLPGATIVVRGTTTGVVSDIDGNFSLTLPQGNNSLVVSFIGYESQEIVAGASSMNIGLKQSTATLDEVVVMGYGVEKEMFYSDRMTGYSANAVKKKEQIPLAIEKRQLNTEFVIEIPYTIPSDNKPHDVTMVEYDIDAAYKYTVVPKFSPDAFLIAQIPDYVKYNLLGGQANIFFKGTFQGESYIDPETSEDTLTLSVGRDKDIIVQREIQKDFTSKGLAGSSRKVQKAWMITVKNNKDIPVDIVIEDQYPVSRSEEIKVDLVESSGAVVNESDGKLTWDITMNPKEKKVFDLIYSVRYPSGRTVIID